MSSKRSLVDGVENIMDLFIQNENPIFSMWLGNSCMIQYTGDDMGEAERKLKMVLDAAYQNQNTDLLEIRLHPPLKKGENYITIKTPSLTTLFVRAFPLNGIGAVEQVQDKPFGRDVFDIIRGLPTHMGIIEQRLTAIEAKPAEQIPDDEFEDEPEPDQIARILALLENPAVMSLVTALAPAIGKIFNPSIMSVNGTPQPAATATGSAIDAMTDEQFEKLNLAVDRLSKHCNVVEDLTSLADLAEMNPQMFAMLLNNLRSAKP